MRKRILTGLLIMGLLAGVLTGCGGGAKPAEVPADEPSSDAELMTDSAGENGAETPDTSQVADASEMTTVEDVVEEGMIPVTGDELNDGTYTVNVSSSSSMFRIADCQLTVADGEMTAALTMGGSSYAYLYPGTAEEAAAAAADALIPAGETEEGNNTFVFPVPALDAGVDCAAFSKNKEQWYPRTLVFRADSLPLEAYRELVTAESLGLSVEDGNYTVEVTLSGGSGRASVASPTMFWMDEHNEPMALVVWSSQNYDYMIVDGEKLLPIGDNYTGSAFRIPVRAFDRPLAVIADTVAMSQPHEIEYSLKFDSSTLKIFNPEEETLPFEAEP